MREGKEAEMTSSPMVYLTQTSTMDTITSLLSPHSPVNMLPTTKGPPRLCNLLFPSAQCGSTHDEEQVGVNDDLLHQFGTS